MFTNYEQVNLGDVFALDNLRKIFASKAAKINNENVKGSLDMISIREQYVIYCEKLLRLRQALLVEIEERIAAGGNVEDMSRAVRSYWTYANEVKELKDIISFNK